MKFPPTNSIYHMGRLVLGGNYSNNLILGSMTISTLNFRILGFNNWDLKYFSLLFP
jgi:hypothetical protein